MDDKDVIIKSLLQRLEELQQQLLAAIEREQQKDKLIEQLMAENRQLAESNLKLLERIAHLEKDSSNSSKPPSSDITNPPDKSQTKNKKRKRGGQKGHKKHTRRKFTQEEIEKTIIHKHSDELPYTALAVTILLLLLLSFITKWFKVSPDRFSKYLRKEHRHKSKVTKQGGRDRNIQKP